MRDTAHSAARATPVLAFNKHNLRLPDHFKGFPLLGNILQQYDGAFVYIPQKST